MWSESQTGNTGQGFSSLRFNQPPAKERGKAGAAMGGFGFHFPKGKGRALSESSSLQEALKDPHTEASLLIHSHKRLWKSSSNPHSGCPKGPRDSSGKIHGAPSPQGCRSHPGGVQDLDKSELRGNKSNLTSTKDFKVPGFQRVSHTPSLSSAPDFLPSTSFVQQQELEFTQQGKTLPPANCFPPPKPCSCSPPAAQGNLK